MKKSLIFLAALILYSFLFGILLNSAFVLAQDNQVSVSGDKVAIGLGNIEINEGGADEDSEGLQEREFNKTGEINTLRERLREKLREEFTRKFRDVNGSTVTVERSVESEDGELKIKIKRTVVYYNGTKTEIEVEIERDENGTTRRIEIGGEGVEVDEEIEINDLFEGNESELEAVLSDGNRTRIRVPPERVRERIRERIRNVNASNVLIQLRERIHNNVPQVVYNVEANQHGRFLGVFKLAMKVETWVDPETGEVIEVNRPWWAFLVSLPEADNPEEEAE